VERQGWESKTGESLGAFVRKKAAWLRDMPEEWVSRLVQLVQ